MTAGYLRRDPEVVMAEVDGKPMLLSLGRWTYLSFNPVGERIWALLAQPRDGESLVRALLEEFEGEEAEIRADVEAFVEKLHSDGFLIRD